MSGPVLAAPADGPRSRHCYAMVCYSNMNRSMEAHRLVAEAGLRVRSFGTGTTVRLPGESSTTPNVYAFGTPYRDILQDLTAKNQAQFVPSRAGRLGRCHRGSRTRRAATLGADCWAWRSGIWALSTARSAGRTRPVWWASTWCFASRSACLTPSSRVRGRRAAGSPCSELRPRAVSARCDEVPLACLPHRTQSPLDDSSATAGRRLRRALVPGGQTSSAETRWTPTPFT